MDPRAPIVTTSLGAITVPPSVRRFGYGLGAFVLVATTGALTGYMAAGTTQGALVGATTHVALLGLVAALVGRGRSVPERLIFGTIGLGAGFGTWHMARR